MKIQETWEQMQKLCQTDADQSKLWNEYYQLTRDFFYGKKLSDLLEAGTPTSAFDPVI